jgi:hypothetical protein
MMRNACNLLDRSNCADDSCLNSDVVVIAFVRLFAVVVAEECGEAYRSLRN